MFKNFDFIGHKKIWFTFSGIMIILSIISIILFRFNWGIDFTGGTILELGFDKNVTVEEVRDGLREDGLQTATIQLSGNMSGETSNDVIIRTRNLSSEEAQTVVGHVKDKVGSGDVKRIETVGAVIGSEVTRSTLLNVLISFGAMILYMSIRFEHRIAISAIVAICHDILMVLGVFAFFDRIRENLHTHRRTDSFATLANDSIHQTIRRSLYTLTTTLFCVASLYFFGGDTTKNFALVMLIGFISGAYSSICVASSIWVTWHEHLHSQRNEPHAVKVKKAKA